MTALHPRLAPRLQRVDADDAVAVLRRLSALTRIAGMLPSIREEDVLIREVVMAMAVYFDRPRMVRMFLADSEGAATLGYEYVAGGAVNRIDVAGIDALAPAHRDLFLAPLRLAPSMNGAGTIISAPLLEGTSLLGLLLVEGTAEMDLDSTELDTLAGIAAQASMAIQHVRSTGRLHARRHLERDLSVARRIQQSFLPKLPERIERFRIAAHYAPAYQIGGDFYDVLPQSPSRLLLTMGDVSGKGVSGALLMARATSELRRISATEASPARVLTEMDRALSGQICDDTFVTAACVSIDSARGVATVANAGHVLPLLRRANGEVVTFGNPSGPPLAMVELTEYVDEMIQVAPGDILLLMTDGILDALHTDEDPLGMAALEALVREMPPDIFDINRRILRAVEERNCLRADDITLLTVELLP